MVHTRTLKIKLDGYGSYLGRSEGCFLIKHRDGRDSEEYPFFEKRVSDAVLQEGNSVSIGALGDLARWDINTIIVDKNNIPVATLNSFNSLSHVKTRVSQYQALTNAKGMEIAKTIIQSKIEGSNRVLEKYNFKPYKPILNIGSNDSLNDVRKRFVNIEGRMANYYFNNIFQLFPEKIRPEGRRTYKAYDGLNNLFNFGYAFLKWRIQLSLLKAKLEPFLGYIHSMQFGKPSLVCDFQELYRYLIDDFLIDRGYRLKVKDFVLKNEFYMKCKSGQRIFLNDIQTSEIFNALNLFFESKVNIPRINVGNKQSLNSLIDEEALLFAKYLRNEKKIWIPRLPELLSKNELNKISIAVETNSFNRFIAKKEKEHITNTERLNLERIKQNTLKSIKTNIESLV